MDTVTDEEYHLSFGLHSGIPLCCAIAFADGKCLGGPCIACQSTGVTRAEMWKTIHWCDGNNPICIPYLERVGENALRSYKNGYRHDPYPKRKVPDDAYAVWLQLPMGDELRDLLKKDGYKLVHLCWPGPSEYWYIYQQPGGEKGICGVCDKKFSIAFPTTGKSVRG